MLFRLLVLFVTVPLVELYLLLVLARHIGAGWTFLIVLGTGALGAVLARRQGWHTWRRMRDTLQRGEFPADALVDALMIFVAGALLLTPGILTDLFGFSLLVPPVRRFYQRHLAKRWTARLWEHGEWTAHGRDQVIDSYVVRRTDDNGRASAR